MSKPIIQLISLTIALVSLFSLAFSSPMKDRFIGIDPILKKYDSKRDLTDWEAIVLGVNGMKIKTQFLATPYFTKLEREIKQNKGECKLVTDYARIVLVYKSHGKDPTRIAGYDFIKKIVNFKGMQNQGINAYIWALIALFGQGDEITAPLVEAILSYRQTDGGFGISPQKPDKPPRSDVDLTAMAITALAPYRTEKFDESFIEDDAVQFLARHLAENGTFVSAFGGEANSESICQVIIALCAANIEITDTRFAFDGKNPLEALDAYRLPDGQYAHVTGDSGLKADPIATRQAALAISAYQKAEAYRRMPDEERMESSKGIGIYEIR